MSLSAQSTPFSASPEKNSSSMGDASDLLERLSVSPLDHDLEIGIVFDSLHSSTKCAHQFKLEPLVRYLDGTDVVENKTHNICLVCQERIALVCDQVVATGLTNCVLFRYGKQTYRLAVDDRHKSWWLRRTDYTAQERMADVLGMNVKTGMKILCKGKVLHPSNRFSPQEISAQLLEISRKDWETAKPSLVAMGTRAGNEVRGQGGYMEIIYNGWYGAMQWGLKAFIQMTQIAFSLVLWPLRSVGLLTPPPRRDE